MKVFAGLLVVALVALGQCRVCTPEEESVADSTLPPCRNISTWDLGKWPYVPYTEIQWSGSMALTSQYLAADTEDDVMCLQGMFSPYRQNLQISAAQNFAYSYYGVNTVQEATCGCIEAERTTVINLFTATCSITDPFAAQAYCYKNSIEATARGQMSETCYRCLTAYNTYTEAPVSAYTTFSTFVNGHCTLNTLLTQESVSGNCPLVNGETGVGIVSKYELSQQAMITVSPNVAVLYAQVTLPNQARATQIFCTQTAFNQTLTYFPTVMGSTTGNSYTTISELNVAQSAVVQDYVTNQRGAFEDARVALLGVTQNSDPNPIIVDNLPDVQTSYEVYAAAYGLTDAHTTQEATKYTPTWLSLNNLNAQVSYYLAGWATTTYNMSTAHAYIGSTCPADFVEATTSFNDQFFVLSQYTWFGQNSALAGYTGYASQFFGVRTTICDNAVGTAGTSWVVLGMSLTFVIIVVPCAALWIKGNEQAGANVP